MDKQSQVNETQTKKNLQGAQDQLDVFILNQTQSEKTHAEIIKEIKAQTKVFLNFYSPEKHCRDIRANHIMGMIEVLSNIPGQTDLIMRLRLHHHWLKLKSDYLCWGLDVDINDDE